MGCLGNVPCATRGCNDPRLEPLDTCHHPVGPWTESFAVPHESGIGPSRHFVTAQYSVAFGEEQTSKAAPSPRSYRRAANSIRFCNQREDNEGGPGGPSRSAEVRRVFFDSELTAGESFPERYGGGGTPPKNAWVDSLHPSKRALDKGGCDAETVIDASRCDIISMHHGWLPLVEFYIAKKECIAVPSTNRTDHIQTTKQSNLLSQLAHA